MYATSAYRNVIKSKSTWQSHSQFALSNFCYGQIINCLFVHTSELLHWCRGNALYHNMNVWILPGNYINFSIAVSLISCVTKASVCYHTLHANQWHVYGKFHRSLVLKATLQPAHYVCKFIVDRFYCGRILLTDIYKLILKVWGSASQAEHSLTMGIVRQQFLSLRGPTWRNNGSSTWIGCCFQHHIQILSGEY